MKRLLLMCLVCGAAWRLPAAEPGQFRCAKDIERAAPAVESIVAVPLDSAVCAAAQPGFADLRIFNAAGQETPYLVERAVETRSRTVRSGCPSHVVSLHERDGGLEIIVALDKDVPAADGLTIVTPLTDYERRVRVSGSRGGATDPWRPLLETGLVFDYSRYMDISNAELRLPPNQDRRFKIEIADIVDAKESPFLQLSRKYQDERETEHTENAVLQRRPFRIDRVNLWRDVQETVTGSARLTDYPLVDLHVAEDPETQTTTVAVRGRGAPLTELTLATSSRNFSRAAEVQTPRRRGAKSVWDDIDRGRLSCIDFAGYHRASLTLVFPECRQDEYRIVIHNQDNPPLAITGVTARGPVYQAVFLAAAGETYRLCYGNADCAAPHYDVAAVLAPLRSGHPPAVARLGAETVNAAAAAAPTMTLRDFVNNPVVWGAIVVVLAAGLAWALFHAARRINTLPKE